MDDDTVLRTGLLALVVGGLAYVGFKFSQAALPDTADTAANQNRFALRFWVAVWATFYRLDPRVIQGIIRQETLGIPGNYMMPEPNGTTSWGPMHVNDVNLASLGYTNGQELMQEMHGVQAGCRLLRRFMDENGESYLLAVAKWNPGQSSYASDVSGYLSGWYGAGLPA